MMFSLLKMMITSGVTFCRHHHHQSYAFFGFVIFFHGLFISTINGKSLISTASTSIDQQQQQQHPPIISSCEIPFSSKVHYRYQWPLIFRTNGSLYPTVNVDNVESVLVSDGDEVLISCGPNYIKKFGNIEFVRAKCNVATGNFTIIEQEEGKTSSPLSPSSSAVEEANIKDLSCDLRVIEEVINSVYGCPEDMTSTNYGYVDPVQNLTYIIGEACYDTNIGRTLFAHVKLGGYNNLATEYLQKESTDYLVKRNHPNARYKIAFFRALHFDEIYERVRKMLNAKEAPGFRISNFIDEPLLSHNQLYPVKKLSWNYFIVHDNLFALDLLKEDIKELSGHVALDIYVGSHGVNVLRSKTTDVQMEFYASIENGHNRFPMPEMIWILVKNQNKATAFGVFNDPDLTAEDVARKSICKSECEKITWLTRVTHSKTYTPVVCCRYEDLRKVVKEVPVWNGLNELYT